MLLIAYKIISYLLYPFIPIYLNSRIKQKKEIKERINERYGKSSVARKNGEIVWIHAASIGESLSILPVVNELKKNNRIDQILVTTGTTSSARILKNKLKDNASHQFIPLDIPIYIKRFLNYWTPSLVIFVESEIWPNFISEIKKRKIKLMILNGRMTLDSFNNWSKFKKTSSKIFSSFDICCTQNNDSSLFYKKLGIKNTTFTGNLKFCTQPEELEDTKINELKKMLGNKKVLVAASTHEGEEEIIANLTYTLRKKHKDFISIIVPRHPNRSKLFDNKHKLNISVRSKNQEIKTDTNIYIADTIGELNLFYKIADFVFIGGSLVNHGGQNPIEAAFLGKTIIHGPNIQNFSDVYEILQYMKMTFLVNNERQLQMYMEDNYSNPNNSSQKSSIKKIHSEGVQALQNAMHVINQNLE